ncbi:DMP19 family protein [Planctomicrobium piriforme]|uniref:DNA mimic protein DMP19 C-terminal domain-containing protein n=1 Tax=Planctomicrobium piriforme TaxID=1576369 RepID=A0A1I3JGB7_9PLAN|nr:DUF4375 domain-containing protein [Planctomicrobium piriforme]SFI59214.1 protein of unknown function [Planctomicrobium piriforme]
MPITEDTLSSSTWLSGEIRNYAVDLDNEFGISNLKNIPSGLHMALAIENFDRGIENAGFASYLDGRSSPDGKLSGKVSEAKKVFEAIGATEVVEIIDEAIARWDACAGLSKDERWEYLSNRMRDLDTRYYSEVGRIAGRLESYARLHARDFICNIDIP